MTLDDEIKKIVMTWSFPTMQQKIKQAILEEIEKLERWNEEAEECEECECYVRIDEICKLLGGDK